jgi:hypothetical protein
MLIVDATDFDEVELEDIIARKCAEFGSVVDVEIHRESDPHLYDLAIVEMSNKREASRVVDELGGREYGASVMIKIIHKAKNIPIPQTYH